MNSHKRPFAAYFLIISFFSLGAAIFSQATQAVGDTTPPVISGITATTTTEGATILWTTNEPSDSRVDYGTAATFDLVASSSALTTNHRVVLSSLSSSTSYHFAVRSTDAAGNVGTALMFATVASSPPPPPPAPAPGIVTRKHDITAYGSSSTSGNQDATGVTYWTRIASTSVANGKVITNKGAGGATDVTILAQATNATAQQKAADAFIQYGGNAFGTAGDAERHFTAFQNHVAAIGHGNFLGWVSHNSYAEPYGSPTWVRARKLARDIANAYPGKGVDMSQTYRFAPPANPTDIADQAADTLQTSYRAASTISHANQAGYIYGADRALIDWVDARGGGLPYIAPYQKLVSVEPTAQTNGGLVIDVPFIGGGVNGDNDLAGVSASVADPDFAVAVVGNALRITRASGTFLTEDRRLLPITVSRNGNEKTYPIYVSIGDLDTMPQQVSLDGNVWMANDVPPQNVTNGKKLTIAFDWQALGADTADKYVLSTANGVGITIRRLSTGGMRIYVRDATTTSVSVFSLTSTQQFRVANGHRWVFLSVDTTSGVQKAQLVVDDLPAIVATPVANATMNLAGPGMTNVFTASNNAANAVNAKVSMIWVANDYLDITQQSVRDTFRNPTTKDAYDLGVSGTVNGVAPYLFIRGSAGDLYRGKNFGTGGNLIWVDKGRAN